MPPTARLFAEGDSYPFGCFGSPNFDVRYICEAAVCCACHYYSLAPCIGQTHRPWGIGFTEEDPTKESCTYQRTTPRDTNFTTMTTLAFQDCLPSHRPLKAPFCFQTLLALNADLSRNTPTLEKEIQGALALLHTVMDPDRRVLFYLEGKPTPGISFQPLKYLHANHSHLSCLEDQISSGMCILGTTLARTGTNDEKQTS
ncbi:hypothetical protein V8F33_004149 [Rhypophila sp. PSN 637]